VPEIWTAARRNVGTKVRSGRTADPSVFLRIPIAGSKVTGAACMSAVAFVIERRGGEGGAAAAGAQWWSGWSGRARQRR
jgi:hypothetical protein